MKKYIFLFLILVLCVFLSGCDKKEQKLNDLDVIKQRGYLIAGVKTDSKPFGYYEKDKLKGLDVDLAYGIANNIFSEVNPANIKYVSVTPQNRISKLNSKEVDILVATMSINDKRKLVIDFSNPYFAANQKIMVKIDSKITSLNNLNTKGKLAVVLGTTGEKISRLACPNANLVGTKTYLEAFNLLSKGQVDAILGDDCILKGFENQNFKIINHSYSKEFYGVALRKSDKSKELLNVVNATIAQYLDENRLKLNKINTTK